MKDCELAVTVSISVGRVSIALLLDLAVGETIVGPSRLPMDAELKVRGVRLCGAVIGRKAVHRAVRL